MDQIEQILSYSKKSEEASDYPKFGWIPSKEEIREGYGNLPKRHKKKYAKVNCKRLLLSLH